jgi:hypothetical protein
MNYRQGMKPRIVLSVRCESAPLKQPFPEARLSILAWTIIKCQVAWSHIKSTQIREATGELTFLTRFGLCRVSGERVFSGLSGELPQS